MCMRSCDHALHTLTSILVRPTSRTNGITRNGNEMSFVVRYRINSNSPSGGIKLMECSVSNLLSLTHWWNWQSSMTTTGLPERDVSVSVLPVMPPRPFASMTILSLMPNLHSGIPLSREKWIGEEEWEYVGRQGTKNNPAKIWRSNRVSMKIELIIA